LRLAHGSTLILLTMPLGVLIAQIDTSVVNLAVKEIGTRLGAGVTALQWVVDACNLVSRSGDARDRLRPRPQRRSGERRRSRQCPRGALGRRVRSRQHRAHDRRHARDRGSRRIVAGLAPAYVGGGIGEMIGAAATFALIRRDSLHPATR
jgi:hypothetical protein